MRVAKFVKKSVMGKNKEKVERMTTPLMEWGLGSANDHTAYIGKKSREYLLEIQGVLSVFEPTGDDSRHGLWLEVPRGKPSDWCPFKEMKECGEVTTRREYLARWKSEFPRVSNWYHVSISSYRNRLYLLVSDNDYTWCAFRDEKSEEVNWDRHEEFLRTLAVFVREKVSAIVQDVDGYNNYIEEHLPYRQREGRISRKELNKIIPWQKRLPKHLKKGIRVLKECLENEAVYGKLEAGESVSEYPAYYREPLPEMSIRIYAKYFRIAHEKYQELMDKRWYRSRKEKERRRKERQKDASLDDLQYYNRHQLGRHGEITEQTNLDSAEDFKAMAFDHYGELGLSRMDVHAADYYTPGGWVITFGMSYSADIDDCVDIAVALYDSGCPLIIHRAEKMLAVLEETDNVRLSPHTFHNYFNHQEEGSLFPLPYECYLDSPDGLTRAEYDEIVSLAHWFPEAKVSLDKPLPEGDPIYRLIPGYVNGPMTLCEILYVLSEHFDVGHTMFHRDEGISCSVYTRRGKREYEVREDGKIFPTANQASHYALNELLKKIEGHES